MSLFRRTLLVYVSLFLLLALGMAIPLGLESARAPGESLALRAQETRHALTLATARTVAEGRTAALPQLVMDFAKANRVSAELRTEQGRVMAAYGPLVQEVDTRYAADLRRVQGGAHVLVRPSLLPARGAVLVAAERMINAETPIDHVSVIVAFSTGQLRSDILMRWLMILLIGVCGLLVVGTAGIPLARWTIRPIDDVKRTVRLLAAGEQNVPPAQSVGPRELRQLSADVNRLASTVQAVIERQRSFLADASHQLRNPLFLLSLRLENLRPYIESAGEQTYRRAQSDIDRLVHTLNEILDISRVIDDNRPAVPVTLQSVLAGRSAAWLPMARRSRVALKLSVADRCQALARQGTVEQVLDILLDNAIKHAPPGSHITISASPADRYADIHVVDQGPGMTKDERKHATGRRWTGTHRDSARSSGLGLSIADMLVGASGGYLDLDAGPDGVGLDAHVRLPLYTADE